jgi:4-amino-4-deoxy-L-arabinose transferase-like glycosyltransferase
MNLSSTTTSREVSSGGRYYPILLGCFAVLLLASHWFHLRADPSWKMGFLTGHDWAGDFYTDEGWEANAATRAVLNGQWHTPGELNLAVESPLWPAILYYPFKVFGVSIALARGIAMTFYACGVGAMFLFARRLSNTSDATLTAALLSANLLGFTFGPAALIEPVFTCFVICALLVCLYAADRESIALSIAAGLLLSFGILVKLTALFAVVPMLAIWWLRVRGNKRLVLMGAGIAAAGILPLLQHHYVISHYAQEQLIYLKMNVTDRRVTGLGQWLVELVRIGYDLRAVGPFLLGAFLLGIVLFLLKCKDRFTDPLIQIGLVWLLANLAIFSTVRYFPPRYCLSLIFPLSLLVVRFARMIPRSGSRVWVAVYALLAMSMAVDCAQGIAHILHPRYGMLGAANEIRRRLPANGNSSCPMSGFMANTLSLYNGLPSANLAWGIQPMWERIRACNPAVYITREDLTEETVRQFRLAGSTLQLEQTFDTLPGHFGDRPELVYSVRPAE